MCGRYVLAYPPRDIGRRLIEDGLPVDEAPDEGDVQHGYNIAPGNIEPVYRGIRNVGDGANNGEEDEDGGSSAPGRDVKYVLEAMKWGLIPSWTKRKPDYGTLMKTINCRDDSLFENKGMWTSMKHTKRCIVLAQGFYEWLKKGNDKIPHYIKRKDGKLLYLAGLWDCVQYEGTTEKLYTYTIITTSANNQLSFLHQRMPVVLETASDIHMWLSPTTTWNTELQTLLKPYVGELDVYPVVKDVGNVRNNSPTFIIPLDSKDNKANIKNFFATSQKLKSTDPSENTPQKLTVKRERDESADLLPETSSSPSKIVKVEDTPQSSTPKMRSATSNLANKKSPASPSKRKSAKGDGTPRITNFFTR